MTPEYINEKEAARITGLSVKTLRNFRWQKREIPYAKIGSACRYNLQDLLDFMESKKVVVTRL